MPKDELTKLLKETTERYEAELARMPGAKKFKSDLLAGFRDGIRSAVGVLRQQGHLRVEE